MPSASLCCWPRRSSRSLRPSELGCAKNMGAFWVSSSHSRGLTKQQQQQQPPESAAKCMRYGKHVTAFRVELVGAHCQELQCQPVAMHLSHGHLPLVKPTLYAVFWLQGPRVGGAAERL